jgi:hypothetical protein
MVENFHLHCDMAQPWGGFVHCVKRLRTYEVGHFQSRFYYAIHNDIVFAFDTHLAANSGRCEFSQERR